MKYLVTMIALALCSVNVQACDGPFTRLAKKVVVTELKVAKVPVVVAAKAVKVSTKVALSPVFLVKRTMNRGTRYCP